MSLKFDSPKKRRKEKAKWKFDSWKDYEKAEKELDDELKRRRAADFKGTVRITSGKAKNFQLDIPPNSRPPTDRMKTQIFDVIGDDIKDKKVLDLYAGSGSFGLEALSRGANYALFVDSGNKAEKIILDNITHTGFLTETRVANSKVADFLSSEEETQKTYDIIFLDPPYKSLNKKRIRDFIGVLDQVKNLLPGFKESFQPGNFGGAIILKHPTRLTVSEFDIEGLSILETYKFGTNSITIFYVNR